MKWNLFTDGGCAPNPGIGGWAFVLLSEQGEIKESGYDLDSTNNRMEMIALLKGLNKFLEVKSNDDQLEIVSDSKYLLGGITSWRFGWKILGWKKKDGKPVLNSDIWKMLDEVLEKIKFSCQHVYGHTGNRYNEIVDEMATSEIKKAQDKKCQNII